MKANRLIYLYKLMLSRTTDFNEVFQLKRGLEETKNCYIEDLEHEVARLTLENKYLGVERRKQERKVS